MNLQRGSGDGHNTSFELNEILASMDVADSIPTRPDPLKTPTDLQRASWKAKHEQADVGTRQR